VSRHQNAACRPETQRPDLSHPVTAKELAYEPDFSEPCTARRGRVQERNGVFLHFCVECGAWGAFGYGVSMRTGKLGRWYCATHRPRDAVPGV